MTVTDYQGWVADGKPWHPAPWINTFRALMEQYGYTVYVLGDYAHLTADPPEDHSPYSHTPWPGDQPYPAVLACDIMPGGRIDWRVVGRNLANAKAAGAPGTEAIKYINWTDPGTDLCWHESWEPTGNTVPSTDTGHVHISIRTDLYTSTNVWDPVANGGSAPAPRPVPAPSGDSVTTRLPLLRYGAKGPAVSNVQSLLLNKGYQAGSSGPRHDGVDGDWGPRTDAAVRQFQADHHVANSVTASGHGDGQCGEHTWSALLNLE